MKVSDVDKVFLALGRLAGLDNFRLAENGCKGLRLEDGSSLAFEWHADHDALYVYTPLINFPEDAAECQRLIRKVLPFNCIASGPIVALNAQDDLILQTKLPAAALTVASLEQAVEMLMSQKKFLLDQVEDRQVESLSKGEKTPTFKQNELLIRSQLNANPLAGLKK
jgi:hypothetical protein